MFLFHLHFRTSNILQSIYLDSSKTFLKQKQTKNQQMFQSRTSINSCAIQQMLTYISSLQGSTLLRKIYTKANRDLKKKNKSREKILS